MKELVVLMMIAEVEMLSWEPGPQTFCHQAFMPSPDCKCMITKYGTPVSWKFHWKCPESEFNAGISDDNDEEEDVSTENKQNNDGHGSRTESKKSNYGHGSSTVSNASEEGDDGSEETEEISDENKESSRETDEALQHNSFRHRKRRKGKSIKRTHKKRFKPGLFHRRQINASQSYPSNMDAGIVHPW
ncbi:hypothetical protein GE061_006610 [Apolygus lucorum]|uniref:Uncharacterized protein n=1 Tax=Apolygus lucorum TaxID=248454 RepID=A0A6A4IRR9_APOLU|nr:hypothetical protein GE061_006610 [Apolygus lucorum]